MRGIENIKHHILIVDDNDDLLEALALMIQGLGYEVSNSSSGNEALEMILKDPYSLVLSDIEMPNGSGVWLLKVLIEKEVNVPVVLMSGGVTFPAELAYGLGAKGFLPKPFGVKEIKNLLNAVLRETATS